MLSCCCSTASTATCSAVTGEPSSRRRTSTGSPASGRSVSRPRHRFAALHAGAPRHPVRLARLPVAAVGLHRGLGGAHHSAAPAGRRDDDAGLGPSAPLRGRGRELPHGFQPWEYVRGHEGDPWRTYLDPSYVGAPALPARGGGWFWQDRLGWADAEDRPMTAPGRSSEPSRTIPGPKTMRRRPGGCATARRDRASPFMLFVDEFDPHEPFDTPEPWVGRYDPEWEGELSSGPLTTSAPSAAGRLTEREGRQIRANYGAKLSMIDTGSARCSTR